LKFELVTIFLHIRVWLLFSMAMATDSNFRPSLNHWDDGVMIGFARRTGREHLLSDVIMIFTND